jgi:hypothetical protein
MIIASYGCFIGLHKLTPGEPGKGTNHFVLNLHQEAIVFSMSLKL